MIHVVSDLPPRIDKRGKTRAMMLVRCGCGFEWAVLRQNVATIRGCRSCAHRGHKSHNRTHGMAGTPVYVAWKQMRRRCSNPRDTSYARYGGRGIRVCERWESFEAFLEDMGPRPDGCSIDRIDNAMGYEPGNCRWATDEDQANNKRNNTTIEIDGVTKTLAEWERESPVTAGAILFRLSRGWAPKDAVFLPAGARGDGRLKPGDQLRWKHGRRARHRKSSSA